MLCCEIGRAREPYDITARPGRNLFYFFTGLKCHFRANTCVIRFFLLLTPLSLHSPFETDVNCSSLSEDERERERDSKKCWLCTHRSFTFCWLCSKKMHSPPPLSSVLLSRLGSSRGRGEGSGRGDRSTLLLLPSPGPTAVTLREGCDDTTCAHNMNILYFFPRSDTQME